MLRLNLDCGFQLTSLRSPLIVGPCKDVKMASLDKDTWILVKINDTKKLQYDTVRPRNVISKLAGGPVKLELKTIDLSKALSTTDGCVFDQKVFTMAVNNQIFYMLVKCNNDKFGLLKTIISPGNLLFTPYRSPVYFTEKIENQMRIFGLSTKEEARIITYDPEANKQTERELHSISHPEEKPNEIFKGRAFQYSYGGATLLSVRDHMENKTRFLIKEEGLGGFKEACPSLNFIDEAVFACILDPPDYSDFPSMQWVTRPDQAGMRLWHDKGDVDYIAKLNTEIKKCSDVTTKKAKILAIVFGLCLFVLVNFVILLLTFSCICYCRKRKLYRKESQKAKEKLKNDNKTANKEEKKETSKKSEPKSSKNNNQHGPCKNVKIALLDDDYWLILRVKEDKTLEYSTMNWKGLDRKKYAASPYIIQFEAFSVDHVLPANCHLDPNILTAFVDLHILYISARCNETLAVLFRGLVTTELILIPSGGVLKFSAKGSLSSFGTLDGMIPSIIFENYGNSCQNSDASAMEHRGFNRIGSGIEVAVKMKGGETVFRKYDIESWSVSNSCPDIETSIEKENSLFFCTEDTRISNSEKHYKLVKRLPLDCSETLASNEKCHRIAKKCEKAAGGSFGVIVGMFVMCIYTFLNATLVMGIFSMLVILRDRRKKKKN
ncbi:unnamed protein product [Bursaphelenchus xylophilus]|uniref:(pine wood nematode) hypothetical protein n=1 Tax=Bursaphelenchus xylophilus TaxID=6326 RepID=A0A811M2J2_BURXY|nr:unnamed protein product [Bursaphelenchus xylophilus]CAG9129722.1 unnamed protein product [Bursaphelenchus xylophilus]